jgi:hypothetical protein
VPRVLAVHAAQGIVVGIWSGCLFLPNVAIVPQWFEPKRRNLALGIVAVGSSVGGVVFPITFHYLLPHVGFGWAVRVIEFKGLVTNITSLAVLRARVVPPTRRAIVDLSMFKDRAFLILCLSLFSSFLGLYAPIFYISPYATQTAVPATVAFYLVPILMLGSGPGCVFAELDRRQNRPTEHLCSCSLHLCTSGILLDRYRLDCRHSRVCGALWRELRSNSVDFATSCRCNCARHEESRDE